MISLECSNCKTVLNIDDAFAGGVCRCQQCGTIQTVPKIGQRPSNPMEEPQSANSPKALFKRKGRIESALSPYNDQLDKAADEISPSDMNSAAVVGQVGRRPQGDGSGMPSPGASFAGPSPSAVGRVGGQASPRVATPQAAAPVPAAKPAPAPAPTAVNPIRPSTAAQAPEVHVAPHPAGSKSKLIFISLGILVLLLLGGAVFYVIFGTGGNSDQTSNKTDGTQTASKGNDTPDARSGTPSICGITLRGKVIVYIVDRAGCTSNGFQKMLAACYTSIESLTTSRKFQMIIWNNHRDLAYPADKPVIASATNLAACQKATSDTYAGASDLSAALRKALDSKDDEIILMSAVDLDDATGQDIRTALDQKSVKFHGIAVGLDLSGDTLKSLTNKFNGSYRKEDLSQLK